MEEEFIKEIKNEVPKLLPEVYKDLAKPAVQEVGKVAGGTAKALLFPIRGMLWGWERIEKIVIEGVDKRLKDIPKEKQKSPDPEISVPLIQALSYTAQNETLREMYLNLLANSMDSSKEKNVHPSFVELIKQMNSLDAKVFDKLVLNKGYTKVINPNIEILPKKQFFINATPEWLVGWTIEEYDIFDVSASIVRLSKFGLIELMFDRTADTDGYDNLKSNQELIHILNKYKSANPNLEIGITATNSVLYVNEYGRQFENACK
ncbi:DUF4393 domain-containing protein [Aliarcobacter butzleri]|uniref:DUF4393 domain-containing protein n=1 Tax=Aliarcobacter butzleri TaxID=28197 RepID=UPI003AD956FE